MSLFRKLVGIFQAAGVALRKRLLGGLPPVYIEDVFSTYLYDGTSSTQVITNEIDLSTKGGLVWIKGRVGTQRHVLTDTNRGVNSQLYSNLTDFEATNTNCVTAFNTTGFTLGANSFVNSSSAGSNTFVSWTFRKQPKFFTAISYTGNGTAGRTVSHNLGSTPGCMIIKRISSTSDWAVYHRSLGGTKAIQLNLTSAATTSSVYWNDTDPTSTVFTLGNDSSVNANGNTYIAYLYAHDAGGFGLTGTDNVISCGSYTGAGANMTVTVGFEPQWILVKRATGSSTDEWKIVDNMRGFALSGSNSLEPNTTLAEGGASVNPTATGFSITSGASTFNASGSTYIYIAIRRGPMKVPTTGTSVFEPFVDRTSIANRTNGTMGPVDLTMQTQVSTPIAAYHWTTLDRLRGANLFINTSSTQVESSQSSVSFDTNSGVKNVQWFSNGGVGYNFRRAPSFFDEVCWAGNDAAPRNITHNLTVVPEMMIVKNRTTADTSWIVYHKNLTSALYLLQLETTAAQQTGSNAWRSTAPTASVFTVGNDSWVNQSGSNYVNYLFATCAGVSKVGSYTGTATTQQIDCGFTGGARFVLIKRTDSTGDWYVWDTARGIIAGNDPYLLMNSAATEATATDYIDPYSPGFALSSTAPAAINASGGTFIFLAIA